MTTVQPGTTIEVAVSSWSVRDDVVQLRVRGTERIYPLPRLGGQEPAPSAHWFVGSGPQCALQLEDPTGLTAPRHAVLIRHEGRWIMVALGAQHELADNPSAPAMEPATAQAAPALTLPGVQLDPGIELVVGGLVLIAESAELLRLRGFLARLLGAEGRPGHSRRAGTAPGALDERVAVVDEALRQLRLAQTSQVPLVLRGDEDLPALAHELHRRVHGDARPFMTYCELHQLFQAGADRRVPRFVEARDAVEAARGGTLCLMTSRLPSDFEALCEEYALMFGTQTQVIICDDAARIDDIASDAIVVPPMSSRSSSLFQVVHDLELEAMQALELAGPVHVDDIGWILCHSASSVMQISQAAQRLAALRKTGSLFEAAELLGMEPASLRRWIGPREIPWLVADHAWDAN